MSTLARKSNLEALKEAQNKKKGGFKYWKPQDNGKYIIRFLPNPDPNGIFYKGVYQHKIGDNFYFCPRTAGEKCPICEKYNKLYKINTEASITLAKSIKPKEQYLYNIVVRQELDKVNADQTHVFIYMAGQKLHNAMMNYFWDEDYGDLTDCDSGYDFILQKEDDPTGSGFPYYLGSKPRKNPSKLFDNDADIEKVLQDYKPLDNEVDILSYDELKGILSKFLLTEYDGGEAFADDNMKAAKPAAQSPAPAAQSPAPAAPAKSADNDDFEASLMASLNEEDS